MEYDESATRSRLRCLWQTVGEVLRNQRVLAGRTIKTSGLKYVFGHGVWVLAGLLDQAVKLRTYIVEDNATIRENLIGTLEELASVEPVGFAETEDEGKVWLKECAGQWDLAIVDLFLRQGSGLGVLAACRARRPGQKMVVLSNYATPDVRMRCAQLGVDAVFDKSNEIDALVDYCIVHGTQRAAAAGAPVNRSACS